MIYLDNLSVVTGRQIAAARTLLGIGQAELASRSTISVPTLKRMEASEGPASGLANNVAAVRRALELAGIKLSCRERRGTGREAYEDEEAMIGISAQPISSAQIEEARKLLGWAKQRLAMRMESNLSLTTLKRLESGEGTIAAANQLIATLKAKGVELVPGGAKLNAAASEMV